MVKDYPWFFPVLFYVNWNPNLFNIPFQSKSWNQYRPLYFNDSFTMNNDFLQQHNLSDITTFPSFLLWQYYLPTGSQFLPAHASPEAAIYGLSQAPPSGISKFEACFNSQAMCGSPTSYIALSGHRHVKKSSYDNGMTYDTRSYRNKCWYRGISWYSNIARCCYINSR